jgi:hypothetical protein
MRRSWRVIELIALPTIALGVALGLAPGRAHLEVRVWLLVILGLALAACTSAVAAAYPTRPSPFTASLRSRRVAPQRPDALQRLEREVALSGSSGFDVRFRLRPVLTDLTAGLLAARRGIDLFREPDRARAVLGEDAWQLVDPAQEPPADRRAEGIDRALLERTVTVLEGL